MSNPDRSGEITTEVAAPTDEPGEAIPSPSPLPRRRILRALSGVAVGGMVLLGLASCGGEDGEGNEDGEEEEDD